MADSKTATADQEVSANTKPVAQKEPKPKAAKKPEGDRRIKITHVKNGAVAHPMKKHLSAWIAKGWTTNPRP